MRIAAAFIACALVAGCSATDTATDTATDSPSELEVTEPAAPSRTVDEALELTRATGSAALSVLILTRLGDAEAAVDGRGFIDFSANVAEVRWADEFGDVLERKTADGLFIQLDPPDGVWFQFDESNATPTSYALSPLNDLDQVSDFVEEGSEQIEGVPTTTFVGTINAQDCVRSAGFSAEDEESFSGDVVCGVTVWIDENGLIVRIDRRFSTTTSGGEEARSVRSTSFFDFGSPVRINTPESYEQAPG